KLVKLDDTNTFHEGWDCSEYSTKFWLKFSGLEKASNIQNGVYNYDYLSSLINLNTENGLFNLPVYQVETTSTTGERHAINGIFVGDDNPEWDSTIDFDDWYFIEPQIDQKVKPGDFSMRNNEGDIVKVERLCYNDLADGTLQYWAMPVVKFDLHNNSPPTLRWKHPDLVLSRPGNPISGIEDIVNPLEKKLNVFPNPVTAGYDLNVIINNGQFNRNGKLGIYNLAGQLVYEQKAELNEDKKIIIPSDKINSLIEGTYFIHFNSTRIKMMAKFVKMQD
ncbi:MAG: T9SS C-terminal target domain-containing protein, partial [Porphyromonadaceae bacterium]